MQEQRNRLADKVAIVTGAGATGSGDFVGIGQATSILFASQGAKVILVDRDEKNAAVTLATIKEQGGEASVVVGDVTSNADCEKMATAAVERYGKLNVLVNNVGISGPGSVTDVDEDLWDTVIDVNLKSVMLTSKHAIPRMIEAGGGSIINLSSIVGLRAGSGGPSHPYAASKGGIIGLSNSMAVHYGRDNVRVNCIAPGHVHSPMVARHSSQEMLDLRRRAGPLGTDGTPWDVAWAAAFLASNESRWISGVTLPVDAGWPVRWGRKGLPGISGGLLCSWPATRPDGSQRSCFRWTPASWRPPLWRCFHTCRGRSRFPFRSLLESLGLIPFCGSGVCRGNHTSRSGKLGVNQQNNCAPSPSDPLVNRLLASGYLLYNFV